MSTIRVEKAHSLPLAEAKKAIEAFGQDLQSKYGLKMAWSGNRADLKGTGASGTVDVGADRVRVEIKLGLIAKAAGIKADKVQASIEKRLDAALA